ncbi:MAG: DUF6456 domain-containing protein [Shimia sp.]
MTHMMEFGTSLEGPMAEHVRRYLLHTEAGISIRALARQEGRHPSTILRQIRRVEQRRDDLLVDGALRRHGLHLTRSPLPELPPEGAKMSKLEAMEPPTIEGLPKDEVRSILRRLSDAHAVLAVARDMDQGVIVRDVPDGPSARTASVPRALAEEIALRDWIATTNPDMRIVRYRITPAGKRILSHLAPRDAAPKEKLVPAPDRKILAETPVAALARRRDATGEMFLSDALVQTAERLLEDFELARMSDQAPGDWDTMLIRPQDLRDVPTSNADAALLRVHMAISDLGPGLGEVALRCCCLLEGLETTEKALGWSARSGKIVLRIALQRLARHYEATYGKYGPLIG